MSAPIPSPNLELAKSFAMLQNAADEIRAASIDADSKAMKETLCRSADLIEMQTDWLRATTSALDRSTEALNQLNSVLMEMLKRARGE